jgi:hypothetical protein
MRIKLSRIPKAMKAQCSKAQGERAAKAALEPWVSGWN